MRWSADKPIYTPGLSTRWKRGFAWFPRTIDSTRIWLERYWKYQIFEGRKRSTNSGWMTNETWKTIKEELW